MSTDHPYDHIPEEKSEPLMPARKGDERRKVRWVRSRDGRSKYAPHAGQKELAKLVGREGTSTPNDNETTI